MDATVLVWIAFIGMYVYAFGFYRREAIEKKNKTDNVKEKSNWKQHPTAKIIPIPPDPEKTKRR